MKTKIVRFIFVLMLVISVLGVSTSRALAEPPAKWEGQILASGVMTGVCAFPVNIDTVLDAMMINFVDKDGMLVRTEWHLTETDTYTANGKTLIGLPFTFNAYWSYDSDGNVDKLYTSGVQGLVPLPDGTVFRSAGRIDFLAHPGESFVIIPDHGKSGNVAGFCAALAP